MVRRNLSLPVVMLLVLLLFTGAAQAQQNADSEAWFYAINQTTEVLTAYTASGETNVILEGVVDSEISQSIGNNEWIARLRTSENNGLFVLRPESATYLQPTPEARFEIDLIDENFPQLSYYPIAAAPPYIVILPVYQIGSGVALLANTETGVLDVLGARRIITDSRQIRFSEDGTRLRYVAELEPQMTAWALRERVLETGEERVIYEQSGLSTRISSDQNGEHWLLSQRIESENMQRVSIVTSTGAVTVLYEAPTGDGVVLYQILDDQMYIFRSPCENNCEFTEVDYSGNTVASFRFPPDVFGYFLSGRYGDTLVFADTSEAIMYALTEDESPRPLGRTNRDNLLVSLDSVQSPDGRYLLVLTEQDDDIDGYQVLDLETGEALFTQPFVSDDERLHTVWIEFGMYGFIAAQAIFTPRAYHYSTATLTEVPAPAGRPFYVLVDGTLLTYEGRGFPDRPIGIYHYDPVSGDQTLLVEGGVPLLETDL